MSTTKRNKKRKDFLSKDKETSELTSHLGKLLKIPVYVFSLFLFRLFAQSVYEASKFMIYNFLNSINFVITSKTHVLYVIELMKYILLCYYRIGNLIFIPGKAKDQSTSF